ncbi:tRNA guanosine-2'-O-methyltransferase [Auricularia subglabra TFB-10046 SS5]|nr:tRNA guanosine-2'-O-methyltransferase [Auricularia subglabra TFB-10046 SS5]
MKILFRFAQTLPEFRIPEVLSVAELHGIPIQIPYDADPMRPFMILDLESEEHARILARRCILIKSVSEFWAAGDTIREVHDGVRVCEPLWSQYCEKTSFKFTVAAHNQTINKEEQRERIEALAWMNFRGKIDLKSPQLVLEWWEEYDGPGELSGRPRGEEKGPLRQIFFGRLLEHGSARSLIHKFDVKKRSYFGNTSMEAEVSLLMANQTLSAPGKLIYDPFVGTGSMLYTVAHFGAMVFGSDIDGRQMRGKQSEPGINRAAHQYGILNRLIDCATFDVTRHPWRRGALFDAIITDPPYGVRAGAKRLGRKDLSKQHDEPILLTDGSYSHVKSDYIPPTRPYELADLALDLVKFARWMLKPGGRLVFFLPTVTDEYAEVDVPAVDGMEVIANSCQDFGNWGRRLITMRKTTAEEVERPVFPLPGVASAEQAHIPAHKGFREKYFAGFGKREDSIGPDAA